jgi:hypothetical protein
MADGTTHLKFDPRELLERLAVLTPRPRINLVLYSGVLAPRMPWRAGSSRRRHRRRLMSRLPPNQTRLTSAAIGHHPGDPVHISGI